MENHEEHDKVIQENIVNDMKAYDCHIVLLEDNGYLPAFAYSIGLYEKFNHPEIVIFGLKNDVMGRLINQIRDEIKNGEIFKPKQTYSNLLEEYEI